MLFIKYDIKLQNDLYGIFLFVMIICILLISYYHLFLHKLIYFIFMK